MNSALLALFYEEIEMSCPCILSTKERDMTYAELKPRITGVTVRPLQGKEIDLKSLWAGRRIVLAFLRHFG